MPTTNERTDRLYNLLPEIYRIRDAEQGYPLQGLLRVAAEQLNLVEDDIAQLYENWFLETAQDWAVPYIGDLIGYRPVRDLREISSLSSESVQALSRILVPRREVANTIRYRRRKGTLPLLELLAADIAGWPARAVEFYRLLGWNQNINHLKRHRAHTTDIHDQAPLDLLNGPFDPFAHTVDVRRINSKRAVGRYNIPSVGVFIWRLRAYSVTRTAAHCVESSGPHCFTFSVLGQDAPLFAKPEPEAYPYTIAQEINVPAPVRRRAFDAAKDVFYGQDKSFCIYAPGWAGLDADLPVPIDLIMPADLSGWAYNPPTGHVAVDPALGRIAFPPSQLPKKGVRVTYRYGFSADMGGGEYPRTLLNPPSSMHPAPLGEPDARPGFKLYRVGRNEGFQRVGAALKQWEEDQPWDAVVELTATDTYVEPLQISVGRGQSLQLRAASGVRPVLRLLDWETDLPDALSVTMAPASRFVLDGLLIVGRPVHFTAVVSNEGEPPSQDPFCNSEILIRHCTLVPGWEIGSHCDPKRPSEPSLELFNVQATLRIEFSILGSIQVHQDQVKTDPIPISISDSILDSTDPKKEALGSPGNAVAHALLTILRSTVFGIVDVHAMQLAQDSIFMDCVNVARRQIGCVRFCYVPPGCRTPRRYGCQPDLVTAVREYISNPIQRDAAIQGERLRVRPQFTSRHYGAPAYAQLALSCAREIERGAEEGSEMGAFHHLHQPQRYDNLLARLQEFTPAGMDVGILKVT